VIVHNCSIFEINFAVGQRAIGKQKNSFHSRAGCFLASHPSAQNVFLPMTSFTKRPMPWKTMDVEEQKVKFVVAHPNVVLFDVSVGTLTLVGTPHQPNDKSNYPPSRVGLQHLLGVLARGLG
jgi:hypothetical protein